jgi:ParB family chromosome partitioning protein
MNPTLNTDQIDPDVLLPNPWNTNSLSPEAELKLENSISRHGMFKPVVVRTLKDGRLQILGGAHRAAAAARLGLTTIPIFNIGEVDDAKAKEIGIIDNGRYGHDDADALSKLLEELGDPADLASFLPFDMNDIAAMSRASKIDLDSLELDEPDAEAIDVSPPTPRLPKTHSVMRFRVPIEDQAWIETMIKETIKDQGLSDSDSMVNAGDALVILMKAFKDGLKAFKDGS